MIFLCVYRVGSAVLAHFFLKEKLQKMGVLGCILCVVGSTMIVLHAPGERTPSSVDEIWELAIQPSKLLNIPCCVSYYVEHLFNHSDVFGSAFLLYTASVIAIVLFLVLYCEPRYGQTNILIYVGICSIIGSLTVSLH